MSTQLAGSGAPPPPPGGPPDNDPSKSHTVDKVDINDSQSIKSKKQKNSHNYYINISKPKLIEEGKLTGVGTGNNPNSKTNRIRGDSIELQHYLEYQAAEATIREIKKDLNIKGKAIKVLDRSDANKIRKQITDQASNILTKHRDRNSENGVSHLIIGNYLPPSNSLKPDPYKHKDIQQSSPNKNNDNLTLNTDLSKHKDYNDIISKYNKHLNTLTSDAKSNTLTNKLTTHYNNIGNINPSKAVDKKDILLYSNKVPFEFHGKIKYSSDSVSQERINRANRIKNLIRNPIQ